MKILEEAFGGSVLLLQTEVYKDNRGYFFNAYSQEHLAELGITDLFLQDSTSLSKKGTVRGMHAQMSPYCQGKLVRALQGEFFDVVVDLRPKSSTFGKWYGTMLSAENANMLWIPVGFAHGFEVRSDVAITHYKFTNPYQPLHEHTLIWNDPSVAVPWETISPIMSDKDKNGKPLSFFKTIDMFGTKH